MKRPLSMLLVAGVAAVITTGCSSSSETSSTATSAASSTSPAVCSSVKTLQASVSDLGNVQVLQNGTAALSNALAAVRSNLEVVAKDAGEQHASQLKGLQTDFDAAESAAKATGERPSAATVSAVATSVSALAGDVRTFAADVASTC